MRPLLTLLALFCFAILIDLLPSYSSIASEIDQAKEYDVCLRLVEQRPTAAFESALAWKNQGGGPAAEHCAASALFALKIYDAAAKRFESLAQTLTAKPLMRAQVLHQAGRSWMLHGDLERSYAVHSSAIDLRSDQADFYIDRAEVLAELGRYGDAVIDLDTAHRLAPSRADILAYRAAAQRYQGNLQQAKKNSEQALVLNPENPEALLERGIVARLQGDRATARKSWLKILELAAGTPAADAAQINLEKLDMQRR